MRALRRNPFWRAVMLVLAVAFTGSGIPVSAAACGDTGAPPFVRQTWSSASSVEVCPVMNQVGPCCCGPEAGITSGGSGDGARTPPGCDCTLQSRDASHPAEMTAIRLVLSFDAVPSPPSLVSFQWPTRGLWIFEAPETGPPPQAVFSAASTRAPPTL